MTSLYHSTSQQYHTSHHTSSPHQHTLPTTDTIEDETSKTETIKEFHEKGTQTFSDTKIEVIIDKCCELINDFYNLQVKKPAFLYSSDSESNHRTVFAKVLCHLIEVIYSFNLEEINSHYNYTINHHSNYSEFLNLPPTQTHTQTQVNTQTQTQIPGHHQQITRQHSNYSYPKKTLSAKLSKDSDKNGSYSYFKHKLSNAKLSSNNTKNSVCSVYTQHTTQNSYRLVLNTPMIWI